jgi:hypothetical protein
VTILLVLLLGAAAADGDAAGPTRLLNCLIDGHVPERPGIADQGGYRFEYQSLRGVTDDDRACAWATFVRYFPGTVDTNLSLLSYGLNADAYHQTAETFMTTVGLRDEAAAGAVASSVGTEIAGSFATGRRDRARARRGRPFETAAASAAAVTPAAVTPAAVTRPGSSPSAPPPRPRPRARAAGARAR